MPGSTILDETLATLIERNDGGRSRITAICLTPFFTAIAVDRACVGAAMSAYRIRPAILARVESRLLALAERDPLLCDSLRDPSPIDADLGHDAGQWPLLVAALRTALAGALSTPWLLIGGDSTFSARASGGLEPFAGARRVLVVGFGGYAPVLARMPQISRLDICDLAYPRRRQEMDAFASEHARRQPGTIVAVSDGSDVGARMTHADVIAITGSALANGTLDGLLAGVPRGTPVIVQGQSAAIHPRALFDRGVQLVQTTVKPPDLLALARADRTGAAMKRLLEGGLPWLDLTPRHAQVETTGAGGDASPARPGRFMVPGATSYHARVTERTR